MSNKILKKKFAIVDKQYAKWEKSGFDVKVFRGFPKNKQEIVFEFIHRNYDDIKLTKGKIDGLIQFIEGAEGGKLFKLNAKINITKRNGKVK